MPPESGGPPANDQCWCGGSWQRHSASRTRAVPRRRALAAAGRWCRRGRLFAHRGLPGREQVWVPTVSAGAGLRSGAVLGAHAPRHGAPARVGGGALQGLGVVRGGGAVGGPPGILPHPPTCPIPNPAATLRICARRGCHAVRGSRKSVVIPVLWGLMGSVTPGVTAGTEGRIPEQPTQCTLGDQRVM